MADEDPRGLAELVGDDDEGELVKPPRRRSTRPPPERGPEDEAPPPPWRPPEPSGPWAKIGPLARPLTTAPEPARWLLWQGAAGKGAGLMRAGKVGILSAPGGTGKTLALCSLALSVLTGRPWLSEAQTMPRRGSGYAVDPAAVGLRVALLLGEEDAAEVHRRLWQVAGLMALDAEERAAVHERLVVGALSGEDVTLVGTDGAPMVDGLARTLAERAGPGFALVILDPLSRFGGVEAETDNGLATRTVGALERLTALPGKPAVLVAHHERKGGGKGTDAVRGASALVDGARWVARLQPVELGGRRWRSEDGKGHRAVWLRLVKTNYTPPLEAPCLVMLDSAHGGAPRVARAGELDDLRDALASGPPTTDERADFAEVPELAGALAGAPKAGAKRAASKASSKGGPAPIGVEL